ncbi:MAG: histidinol-phosphatase [Chordicoccus sp.]|jgi:histidinol-phosphatase (PHP family)
MHANYHTHTYRCRHAEGTEREYIERAIEGGLKVLGFSDHTPMPVPDEYYVACPTVRMHPEEFEGYCDTVLALKNEYRRDIDIKLGVEAEYVRPLFEEMTAFLDQYPLDYMILGQHVVGNILYGDETVWSSQPHPEPSILHTYLEQVLEALRTGRFLYVAHPDLIHFTGDPAIYDREMRTFCQEVKKLDIPLEINFLGLADHRNYPNQEFWKIAGEIGNRVVFGSDAHRPVDVWQPGTLRIAEEMVRKYNLNYDKKFMLDEPGVR